MEGFTGEPPPDKIRVMDCIDCHNRPSHVFPTANDAVEQSLVAGTLSTTLPNIKRVAVQAMTQAGITTTGAPEKIATFIKSKYTDAALASEVNGAVAEVNKIFSTTIFPERKADWRMYPNNIGHKDWLGCFRCHDGKHKPDQGEKMRATDCTACHTILAQGKGAELALLDANGLEFKHPDVELDPELTCADCHTGGIQK